MLPSSGLTTVNRRVVAGRQRDVVARDHVLEVAVEPLRRHRDAAADFVRQPTLSAQLIRPLRSGSNRASERTPKFVGRLAKLISQPAVRYGAAALALGDVVAVDVGPRQRLRGERRRVVELREAGGRPRS